jgi:hypothetical protein
MAAPTREEAVDLSDKTYDALVYICSAHPKNTFFPRIRRQLYELIEANNGLEKYFSFNRRYGYSPQVDGGITEFVVQGLLQSLSPSGLYMTCTSLYNQRKRIEDECVFTDEEKAFLNDIGRKLQTREL